MVMFHGFLYVYQRVGIFSRIFFIGIVMEFHSLVIMATENPPEVIFVPYPWLVYPSKKQIFKIKYTPWLLNIAMENGIFIYIYICMTDDLPIENWTFYRGAITP